MGSIYKYEADISPQLHERLIELGWTPPQKPPLDEPTPDPHEGDDR